MDQYRSPYDADPTPAGPAATPRSVVHPVAGWVLAVLPLVSCGLLTFVPFLRAGLIRPRQKWALISAGLGLEAVVVVNLVVVGNAPEDADGHVTGLPASVATALLMMTIVVAVVLAAVFRDPILANLNVLSSDQLAKRAGIPIHDAEQVLDQRAILGHFDSVDQAIAAADLSGESAARLRQVGVV